MKSEPQAYSIQDLAAEPTQTTCWDGVRNYQARNFMRDQMQVGDRVLFYHSNADPPAIVGTARVSREAYPDHTAFDTSSKYYDPKSSQAAPRWFMVDLTLDEVFAVPLALPLLREQAELKKMELLRKGSRLSVQPVTEQEFTAILALAAELKPGWSGG